MTNLGERIVIAVERSGLTRSGLANVLGISRQAVNNWIKGKNNPSTKNLSDIAAATGVRMEWLALDQGPQEKDRADDAAAKVFDLSTDILEDVINGIEEVSREDGLELSAKLKSKLITELYRQAASAENSDLSSENTVRAVIGYAIRSEGGLR